MVLTFLKAKIHRATVTEANLEYEGSVTIDRLLLNAAGIAPYEQVHIYNISNGERLITYAIEGPPGSGVICINGAGAHLVKPDHLVIICAYAQLSPTEVALHVPRVIHVDGRNHQKLSQ